ncbi:DUF1801 domain-containing protein [Pedobacter polaris]|uniref:DUF1801 domain-containing protein n=1 Tax=Pedobacter polaris TaxID=2571273 RepID=A0A4U1CPP9_9SPHI|nr:DUF1801 domain-containing protein [Pedobacter polaris]TKC10037.1 DUF1801 domain-containing protein [Pedobacter polaris]
MKTDLVEIFQTIRAEMQPYTVQGLNARTNSETAYELWSEKAIEIEGRKKDEVYFAGVVIRKGYVGFYYMPVYAEAEMKLIFHPELMKLLKGKSCFHIKKLDDELLGFISQALVAGFTSYKQKGWV